jgi:hypothetical protein
MVVCCNDMTNFSQEGTDGFIKNGQEEFGSGI